jgi:methionine-gamma-lyase
MQSFDPSQALASARHEFGEHGGVNMSIEASTTFTVMDAETMPEIFAGQLGPEQGGCYLYGRHFNPTVFALGKQLAAISATESAYCTSSGMAAIACAVMQECNAGDHIVASDTLYGGTFALFKDYLPAKAGLRTTFVDVTDLEAVERAMEPGTKLLYAETVANPTLEVADIPALADVAHAHDAKLVIDNTFCPMLVTPGKLGADVVTHSLTKFVSGCSDIIAGAVCGTKEFILSAMDLHTGSLMLLGPTMDPRVAFQLSLRLPHLGARMIEHSKRAMTLAKRLREAGVAVVYPGLDEHPQHELFTSLMNKGYGYGGLLTIDAGTEERADDLLERLQNKHRFGFIAVSLGYFETLMSCSASSTSSELSEEDRARAGVSLGLVRLSIGLTGDIEERWRQLDESLRHVGLV